MNIFLEHNDTYPNEEVGQKFKLGGIPDIRRMISDNGISYSGDDTLKSKSGKLIKINSHDYQAERNPSEVYTYDPITGGFKYIDTAGNIFEFGTTSNSKILKYNTNKIRVWALSRIINPHQQSLYVTYQSL